MSISVQGLRKSEAKNIFTYIRFCSCVVCERAFTRRLYHKNYIKLETLKVLKDTPETHARNHQPNVPKYEEIREHFLEVRQRMCTIVPYCHVCKQQQHVI